MVTLQTFEEDYIADLDDYKHNSHRYVVFNKGDKPLMHFGVLVLDISNIVFLKKMEDDHIEKMIL